MYKPNIQNTTPIMSMDGVTITSDLDSKYDQLIVDAIVGVVQKTNWENFDATVSSIKDVYYSGLTGMHFEEYTKDLKLAIGMAGSGLNITYPNSIGNRFYNAQFETVTDVAGRDTLFIETRGRTDNQIFGTIAHEILHESKALNIESERAAQLIMKGVEDGTFASLALNLNLDELKRVIEHSNIGVIVDKISQFSGRGAYFKKDLLINTALYYLATGTELVYRPFLGISTKDQAILDQFSREELITMMGVESQGLVLPLSVGEGGNVQTYINEQGNEVTVTGSGNLRQLNFYAEETVGPDGSITSGYTFGSSMRILGDWLGLDGDFGIQGNFARPGEGAGGVPGAQNSGEKKDVPKGDQGANQGGNQGGGQKADQKANQNRPILLDLDGDGVRIDEISRSNVFVDAGGEGLSHRSAWAAAGDGVLFYDPDGRNDITEKRQYVFTEWDPTATSDLAAVRAVFDSDGDGKLTALDAEFAKFKVMVTNADGSRSAKTLTELGITEINLTADATHITLPDGSVITGQTSFTRVDLTTGTVANATLVAEAQGHRVEEVESVDGSGTRVLTVTGYDAAGGIAFVMQSTTSADGASITNVYDDNGDGVSDRIQTIDTVVNGDGSTTEMLVNKRGADAASAITINRVQTTTSADGSEVTIERDTSGGGWFSQSELRSTLPDGSRTTAISDLAKDGSVIRSSAETISVDGLTRVEAIDEDGDGQVDLTVTHVITVDVDGSRTETITQTNGDGSLRATQSQAVSADGQANVITRDVDGDGSADTVEDLAITVDAAGASVSVLTVKNGDGSTRSSTTKSQSADTLSKTNVSDLDGDGITDRTTVDATTIATDGARSRTVTATNGDGSVRAMGKDDLAADKVTSETWRDLDQSGTFEATDLVRSVSVDGTTQARTETSWDRSADGSVRGQSTKITSADGFDVQTSIDADGDGDTDTAITDLTSVAGDGSATRAISVNNQDGSLRNSTSMSTSADGLTKSTQTDRDGDGAADRISVDARVLGGDGSTTRTASSFAGDGTTLLAQSVVSKSADRNTVVETTDADGDGNTDAVVSSVRAVDGATSVTETRYYSDGTVAGSSNTSVSANGLVRTTETDLNGDAVLDVILHDTTVLNIDGSRTRTAITNNGDGSLRSQGVTTISDDRLTSTRQSDADGDDAFERVNTSTRVLSADGSETETHDLRAEDGSLLSSSSTYRSDDGLTLAARVDADGDGSIDLARVTTTALLADGGILRTEELRDAADVLRERNTFAQSDNGRSVTSESDINGDGQTDIEFTKVEADDGTVTEVRSELNADGTLQSKSESLTSADRLSKTVTRDHDGDGVDDLVTEDTTLLGTDGAVTRTLQNKAADGSLIRQSVTVTSDDGLSSTRTVDEDGDGVVDLTTTSGVSLSSAGVETTSVQQHAADSSLLSASTVVVSADRRTITETLDSDGNGNSDRTTITELADDGTVSSNTSFLSSGGALESTFLTTVSGDGNLRTSVTDRNGDGEAELIAIHERSIGADGTTRSTSEYRSGNNVALGNVDVVISDDGLFAVSTLDLDGDRVAESVTKDETRFDANGDISRTIVTRDATFDLLSKITTIDSGNGLFSSVVSDFSGDGIVDRTMTMDRQADGAWTETTIKFGSESNPLDARVETMSADGRTHSLSIDWGGGGIDRTIVAQTDLSRNVVTTSTDLKNGVIDSQIKGTVTANGMQRGFDFDIDGDGAFDFSHTTAFSYLSDGSLVASYTQTVGASALTYSTVTTTSADGFSSTRTEDIDGDGIVDGTRVTETILHLNGDRQRVQETHYADGDLHSRSDIFVSADGRFTREVLDYDGNGIADKVKETVIEADGSRTETETAFDEGGMIGEKFVTLTTADGLQTSIVRFGNVQTITRAAHDNGSYVWDNGITADVGATHTSVSHEVDAAGIETWSISEEWREVNTHGTVDKFSYVEVRLDGAAKAQVFDDAARVYDTILDRGLDFSEREVLVNNIADEQLNKTDLISQLLNSGEFATRYGTLSDAEFVTQIYHNALGRAPSLSELDEYLRDLDGSPNLRKSVALEISESIEHFVVGNGHMSTNNFDVIINPATYERSLDKAYVKSIVASIADVVFDRDATGQELEYLSDNLLKDLDNPDDIATKLLAESIDLHGVQASTLHGLSGAELVFQAYMNAFGRLPSSDELQVWEENLSEGRITEAQFIASIALSPEHSAEKNGHVDKALPDVNVIEGTAGADNLTGTAGQDEIRGGDGNDILNGGTDSDKLIGGLGDDTLKGGAGYDVYQWSKGDGNDVIDDASQILTGTDSLILTDVSSSEVSLSRALGQGSGGGGSDDDLIITITSAFGQETITVKNRFQDPTQNLGIETIVFADGETWTLNDILAQTKVEGNAWADTLNGSEYDDNIYGLTGNDTINGNGGQDTLIGGKGIDTLLGGEGGDTYVWEYGDGSDTIKDTHSSLTDVDRLILSDVNSSDVTLQRNTNSDDLEITVFGLGQDTGTDGVLYYELYQTSSAVSSVAAIPTTGAAGAGRVKSVNMPAMDAAHGGNGEYYAARLYGVIEVTSAGSYTFKTGSDDGSMLWIDGVLAVDNDGPHSYKTEEGSVTLAVGQHTIEVGFFEKTGDDGLDIFVAGPDTGGAEQSLMDSGMLGDATGAAALLRMDESAYAEFLTEIDLITVTDQYYSGMDGRGLEVIEFGDGTVWTLDDILALTRVEGTSGNNTMNGTDYADHYFGLAGNDTIYTKKGDDVLVGGLGDDTLGGDGGSDRYIWSRGDGNDVVDDNSTYTSSVDTLELTDVASDEIELSRVSGSTNLLIRIPGSGGDEVITIKDQYDSTTKSYGIEVIEFSDGVIWTLDDILARTKVEGTGGGNTLYGEGYRDNIYGLDGNDTIIARDGDDVLVGGTGNDTLRGDGGNDSYIWSIGDGNDTLDDQSSSLTEVDTLILTDVEFADVALSRNGDDLLVTVTSSSETITVRNRFEDSNRGYGVEFITFSDGVRVEILASDLAEAVISGTGSGNTLSGWAFRDTIYGLGGNDTIYGNDGDDVLIGGLGDDDLKGGDGADRYVWQSGDGDDDIDDTGASRTETDTLVLTDIASDGVLLTRVDGSGWGGDDLIVTIISTGETIEVDDRFKDPTKGYGIEAIEFSDGVTWTLDDILAQTRVEGTSGNDTMNGTPYADNYYGFGGNDTIYAKAGDDTIVGGLGDDTVGGLDGNDRYIWSRGDGNDQIDDNGLSNNEIDTLVLTDVTSSEIELTRANGGVDLIIRIPGPGGDEVITDKDRFVDDYKGYGIEAIEFSDGEVWNFAKILAETKVEGTSSNDTINGTHYDDNLYGLGGDDSIYGSNRADTIVGGQGNDYLAGNWGNDRYIWSQGDGNDVLNDNGTPTDQIDTLVLTDVPSTGIALSRLSGGVHLLVTIIATGEVITVNDRFLDPVNGVSIEAIEFSDGVIWSLADIIEKTRLDGTAGDDVLQGSLYADNMYGRAGNDTIYGNAGNDVIDGGGDNDLIYGKEGNDRINGGNGDDEVYGAEGDDLIYGDAGNDTIYGNAGNDVIEGGGANDLIYGMDGNDQLSGGSGDDEVYGAEGDDLIYGDAGNDTIYGNAGNDVIEGGGDNDLIYGMDGNDQLSGGSGDDVVYGADGNDLIYGDAGDDTLNGASGDDILDGGLGSDILTGGAGSDVFRFADVAFGNDHVTDFEDGLDYLEFSTAVADSFDDFVITGNGTNSVSVSVGDIELIVSGAAAINLTESDFVFSFT